MGDDARVGHGGKEEEWERERKREKVFLNEVPAKEILGTSIQCLLLEPSRPGDLTCFLLTVRWVGTYLLNSPASQELMEHDVCQPHLTSRVQDSCFSTHDLPCLFPHTQGSLQWAMKAGHPRAAKRKLTRVWCCLVWQFSPLPKGLAYVGSGPLTSCQNFGEVRPGIQVTSGACSPYLLYRW